MIIFCCGQFQRMSVQLWRLCRSEILIKAQTKEVWPFQKKTEGWREGSFWFHVEIVETG